MSFDTYLIISSGFYVCTKIIKIGFLYSTKLLQNKKWTFLLRHYVYAQDINVPP